MQKTDSKEKAASLIVYLLNVKKKMYMGNIQLFCVTIIEEDRAAK
jgi:hypothetical protein